jgi:hypothetical protein
MAISEEGRQVTSRGEGLTMKHVANSERRPHPIYGQVWPKGRTQGVSADASGFRAW